MDTQGLLPPPVKRHRRRHSRQFKQQVVTASFVPGASIAGVAREFEINANLVHNWRKQLGQAAPENTDFIRVAPLSMGSDKGVTAVAETLRVEIASALGTVTLHWPMARLDHLAAWLKSS